MCPPHERLAKEGDAKTIGMRHGGSFQPETAII
jgi:hypothetical protein